MSSFQDFLSHFHKFLEDCKIKEEEKISSLSSQKIVISGALFLRKMLQSLNLNPCKGTSFSILSQQIANFNSIFLSNNVRYMLVFTGLGDFEYSFYPEYKTPLKSAVREMWKFQIKKEFDQSFTQIKNLYPFYYINQQQIFSVLEELGIEYLIAPYHEMAQIRRLYSNEYVNAIAADLDFLAFSNGLSNFVNLILDFDFEAQKFIWVDCKKVLAKLQINQDQINEFFLLAGIFHNGPLIKMPTDKEILKETNVFQQILNAERRKDTISNLMDPNVLNHFYHDQRKKLESVPVLSSMCEIELYSNKEFLDKMKDLFGAFLPLQVYIFFCFGLLSKELVFALSRGKIYSKIPIADSLELRALIDGEFVNLYKKTFGILTAGLSISYKKQSFSLHKYFEVKDKPIIGSSSVVVPKLYPSAAFINQIREKCKSSNSSFVFAIQVFLNLVISSKAESTNKPSTEKKEDGSPNTSPDLASNKADEKKPIDTSKFTTPYPSTFEEIACYSRLLLLHHLDLLNLETKEPTVLSSGLRKIDESFEEPLLIIQELMKSSINHIYGKPICDAFKIRKLSCESSPGLNSKLNLLGEDKIKEEFNLNTFLNVLENQRDEEKESLITCISRIFAFVTPSTNYVKLRNVYDYDSSQYLAILSYTQNILSNLNEAIVFNVYVNGEKKNKGYSKVFFEEVKKSLAKTFKNCFQIDVAIAVKMVLQMKDCREVESFCNNDEKILGCLRSDFGRGVKLWDEIITLLKYQEKKEASNPELNKLFMLADGMLKNRLKELKIL